MGIKKNLLFNGASCLDRRPSLKIEGHEHLFYIRNIKEYNRNLPTEANILSSSLENKSLLQSNKKVLDVSSDMFLSWRNQNNIKDFFESPFIKKENELEKDYFKKIIDLARISPLIEDINFLGPYTGGPDYELKFGNFALNFIGEFHVFPLSFKNGTLSIVHNLVYSGFRLNNFLSDSKSEIPVEKTKNKFARHITGYLQYKEDKENYLPFVKYELGDAKS
ncbi:hypothetical protein HOD29_04135 [archaeon]|jgi:hypothetical protein|nr:hypothetical protein [archaeon]